MRHVALCCLLVLGLAAVAAAAEKGEGMAQDKSWQATEPYWNPIPGDQILADVPESEPANNTCPGQAFSCGDVLRPAAISPAGDVDFIYFTANLGDLITFGTDADGNPTPTDTKIYLYNADCSVQLAYDDDSGPGYASLITNYYACYTGTYVGKITGYSSSTTGIYKAFVTCTPGTLYPPYGDTCADATPLPCGPFDLTGNTGCSTNNYSPPTPSCTRFSANGRDQVLAFTVNAGGTIDLSYRSTADGSVYIYDTCDPQHCLVGEDSTVTGGYEDFQYTFTAAGTYYLILDTYGTNTSGTWTLTGVLECGPVAVEPRPWTHVKRLYR
jgi:hypothetical protein